MRTVSTPSPAPAAGAGGRQDPVAPRRPIDGYRRLVQRLGHFRWFAATLRALGARLDRGLYRASHGRLAITGPSLFPILLLTTTGRRSGKPRTTPVIYHRDGSRLIVSSENFGQRRPAAWPLNLLADPVATVQLGATRATYTARLATADELARYWPALVAIWPAHATYHRRSGARRMFVLEPASGGEQPAGA
jgi:deazaflavin-dependent oxidoreductase (nitroreductase family)